jgi:hypothetical protein
MWGLILSWIIEKIGWGYMDWIQLTQDRDQGQALASTVMNLRVS